MSAVAYRADLFYPAFVDADEKSTATETIVIPCGECPGVLLVPWSPDSAVILCCVDCGAKFRAELSKARSEEQAPS